MTPEQLNSARMARWSQNGEARLTTEAAAEWLGTVGFCRFLPNAGAPGVPSASLLEAVVGRPALVPSAGERARALDLLVRLIDTSAAVPLKLGTSLGELPDFLVSAPVLPYVYALLGNRNFKGGPAIAGPGKVTPLAQHCWQALEQKGSVDQKSTEAKKGMDMTALQRSIGSDITEAAIARALQELWAGMYIVPVLSARGEAASWELMSQRYPEQVAAGARTGHAEAQSALVSLYLHAVVAAAEEEVLAFLSPLASQSKLREVIRGLAAMRQLDMIDVAGRPHLCLQGGLLPEMVEQLSEEQLAASRPAEGQIEILNLEATEDTPQTAWQAKTPQPSKPARASIFARPRKPEESGDYVSGERSRGYSRDSAPRPAKSESYSRPPDGGAGPERPAARRTFGGREDRPKRWEKPGAGEGQRPYTPKTDRFKPAGDKPWRPRTSEAKPWQRREPSSDAADSGSPDSQRPNERGSYQRRDRRPTAGAGFEARRPASRFGDSLDSRPKVSRAGASSAKDNFGDRLSDRRSDRPNDRSNRRSAAESGERPKRWGKSEAYAEGKRPFAPRIGGFKPRGSRPGGSRPGGSRPGAPKPWAATSRDGKPWEKRGASADKPTRGMGERAKRWEKSNGPGDGERPPTRPFAARREGGESSASRPSRPRATESRPARSENPRSETPRRERPESKSSKTGAGGIFSWKSLKPFAGKSGAGKPWAKRSSSKGGSGADSESGPKRTPRETEGSPRDGRKPRAKTAASSGERAGAKPFWAKNPRGGKGFTSAKRINRSRGKKK